MANSEVVRTPEIDPERSNYRSFWSKDWAKQILDTTKGTDIEQITIDLVISWRCQSEVLASPDTFVEVVYRMISSYQRPAGWQKIAKALADNLKKEVPSLTKQQVVELFTALAKIHNDMELATETKLQSLGKNQLWDMLVDPNGNATKFWFSIMGSCEMVYAAIYFAYENYVTMVTRKRLNLPESKKIYGGQVGPKLDEAFSDDLAAAFFDAAEIKKARFARNSICHCGARLTEDLIEHGHDFEISPENRIIVFPHHSKELFDIVSDLSLKLAERHLSNPVTS